MAIVTINTPGGAEDTAALANIGRTLGLGRPATLAEVKGALIRYLKEMNATGAELLAAESARSGASINLT